MVVQRDSIGPPRECWQRTFDSACGLPLRLTSWRMNGTFRTFTEEVLKLGYQRAPSGKRGNSMSKDGA